MDPNAPAKKKLEMPGFVKTAGKHVAKHRFIYMYIAAVVLFAVILTVGFAIDAAIADFSNAKLQETRSARYIADPAGLGLDGITLKNAAGTLVTETVEGRIKSYTNVPVSDVMDYLDRNGGCLAEVTLNGGATEYRVFSSRFAIAVEGVRTSLFNENATRFARLITVILRIAAAIGLILIVTKSPDIYKLGFDPAIPHGRLWTILTIATLALGVVGFFFALLVSEYAWTVLLLLAMAFSDTVLMAFGSYCLRKLRAPNVVRIILPVLTVYVTYGLYFLMGSIGSYGGFTFVEAMGLGMPKGALLVWAIGYPLFAGAVYMFTNSIVASMIPPACAAITFAVFPNAIQSFGKPYVTVFFFLAFAAVIGGAIAVYVFLIRNLIRREKYLPGDLNCDYYNEEIEEEERAARSAGSEAPVAEEVPMPVTE